jgi:hypothetical protein
MASANENKPASGGGGGGGDNNGKTTMMKMREEREETKKIVTELARLEVELKRAEEAKDDVKMLAISARVHEIYCARTPLNSAAQSAKIAAFDATFVEIGNRTLWWGATPEATRRAMMRTELRMNRWRRTASDTRADPFTLQEASVEFDSLKGKYALLGVLVPGEAPNIDGDYAVALAWAKPRMARLKQKVGFTR